MSYLRGLVRKTRAPRPQIVPRALPVAASDPGLAETIESIIVTPARAGARAEPLTTALPIAPAARHSPATGQGGEPSRPKDAPAPTPADPVLPAARIDAPQPVPQGAASQTLVSCHIRTVPRTTEAPRQNDVTQTREETRLAADPDPRLLVRARAPRPAEREPWRDARAEPVAAPAAVHKRELARPDVHISIGRLEVRATVAPPENSARSQAFQPQLTLQDYLARRSRGQR